MNIGGRDISEILPCAHPGGIWQEFDRLLAFKQLLTLQWEDGRISRLWGRDRRINYHRLALHRIHRALTSPSSEAV